MKVLVIGGGGFLGRYVVYKLLSAGHEVRVLGRADQPELRDAGAEVIQGDLGDAAVVLFAAKGVDAVQHIAAKAGVWGPWDIYYRTNVTGTQNVLNACKKNRINHLVYTSTPRVVFNGADLRNVDESQPYGRGWMGHYAHTKIG